MVIELLWKMGLLYLWILHCTKWPVSETPYLIEQTAVAPDITGSGVFSKVYCFWSCPLYGHFATLGYVVIVISQVPGHPKVSNLARGSKFNVLYEF